MLQNPSINSKKYPAVLIAGENQRTVASALRGLKYKPFSTDVVFTFNELEV